MRSHTGSRRWRGFFQAEDGIRGSRSVSAFLLNRSSDLNEDGNYDALDCNVGVPGISCWDLNGNHIGGSEELERYLNESRAA